MSFWRFRGLQCSIIRAWGWIIAFLVMVAVATHFCVEAFWVCTNGGVVYFPALQAHDRHM